MKLDFRLAELDYLRAAGSAREGGSAGGGGGGGGGSGWVGAGSTVVAVAVGMMEAVTLVIMRGGDVVRIWWCGEGGVVW